MLEDSPQSQSVIELRLYSGPNCRLCEEAKQLIWPVIDSTKHQFTEVDITSSLELKKRYGFKIPVLKRMDTEAELEWPFDIENLAGLLQ